MEAIILEILDTLRGSDRADEKFLERVIHKHNKNLKDIRRHHAKKKLLPYYLKIKEKNPQKWESWEISPETEKRLFKLLQVKPRRTASGVATITVITKPWRCFGECLYCPNDLRMPKSYLADEPACQRAEKNFFDPYLQVASRLRTLTHMGHVTDKIELIILGGSWSDYPREYQIWFVSELFRALNDGDEAEENARARRRFYQEQGLSNREEELIQFVEEKQAQIRKNSLTYNTAVKELYLESEKWQAVSLMQVASFEELQSQQSLNETAQRRMVGLVVETRPETITSESLLLLRSLGCTKVQIGIQSVNPEILTLNDRNISIERIQKAFELLRLFGFKIHAHFMLNLLGATPEEDILDYRSFVTDPRYIPDEIKLYPCSLVEGTGLCSHFEEGSWKPYTEDELLEVLVADTLETPPFIRISRMIRDISAHDIVTGNKKANLRQMVEGRIEKSGKAIREIRHRELNASEAELETLELDLIEFETTVTHEYFLQWITPENRIAGFLRLSLPKIDHVDENQALLPVAPGEAMIREVHVYGKVAGLRAASENAQHLGLGRRLIEAATKIAREKGYTKLNVISSVGTREYYRSLGFRDNGLYQQRELTES